MQEITLLWADISGVFSDRGIGYDYRMHWGPNDQSIFIEIPKDSSGTIEYTRIVYTLSDQIATTLSEFFRTEMVNPPKPTRWLYGVQ